MITWNPWVKQGLHVFTDFFSDYVKSLNTPSYCNIYTSRKKRRRRPEDELLLLLLAIKLEKRNKNDRINHSWKSSSAYYIVQCSLTQYITHTSLVHLHEINGYRKSGLQLLSHLGVGEQQLVCWRVLTCLELSALSAPVFTKTQHRKKKCRFALPSFVSPRLASLRCQYKHLHCTDWLAKHLSCRQASNRLTSRPV